LRVGPAKQLPALESLFPFLFSVAKGELIRFFRQLAVMLGSGDNLLSTLDILYLETRGKPMRHVIDSVRKTLVTGGSFSSALAQFPTVFDSVLVAMVAAGEHTGRLGPALDQLAEIIEKEEEAKKKAIKTLMYPMAIIGLSLVTLAVLITVALPPLLASFDQLGAEVPRMTRIALGLVSMVEENLLNVILGFLSMVISLRLLRSMPRARYLMEKGQLKLPFLGSLTIARELARFSRTITLLLEAGVSPSEAFQLAAKGCKNSVLQRAYADAEDSLMSGHGIAEGLKLHSLFPRVFVRLSGSAKRVTHCPGP
jgi:type IV pilus assembly protein PilC